MRGECREDWDEGTCASALSRSPVVIFFFSVFLFFFSSSLISVFSLSELQP
jgi:hypothetical protein